MIQTVKDLVASQADAAVALAKEIWNYAELSYEEVRSAAALMEALKKRALPLKRALPVSPRPSPPLSKTAAASLWSVFWRNMTPWQDSARRQDVLCRKP